MSRRRGRPARHYRLRIRTVRHDPIDYAALARAALEQAAMTQPSQPDDDASSAFLPPPVADRRPHHPTTPKEPRRDRLA